MPCTADLLVCDTLWKSSREASKLVSKDSREAFNRVFSSKTFLIVSRESIWSGEE